jgi:uncharacterized protein (TIGR02271 family)
MSKKDRKNKNKDKFKNKNKEEFAEDAKMLLREERLDIDKDRVNTGEVTLHKDIFEEHKNVDVPVTHDEVIVEKRAFNEDSDAPVGREETWHIPTSKDEINVGKHTVVTGEVEAHKKSFQEKENVDEILKKEKARVDKDGHPNVISKDKDKFRH